jgi:hypothetical protein
MLDHLLTLLSWIATPFLRVFYAWDKHEVHNTSDWAEYNETITLAMYTPRLAKKGRRLTILSPILGGRNLVAKAFAMYFAIVHQRPCVIVYRGAYPFTGRSPEAFNEKLKAFKYNYRIVEEWLYLNGYMIPDQTETVAIGASMGGIITANLAVEDRYDRYISIVGGTPILEIMYDSELDIFRRWFTKRAKDHQMSVDEVLDYYYAGVTEDLPHQIVYNEQKGGPIPNPEKLFTITALYDDVVPTRYQREFRKLGLVNQNLSLPAGHYSIALWFPVLLLALSYWTLTTKKSA